MFITTKQSVYKRKGFISHRIGLVHQHGCHQLIVLGRHLVNSLKNTLLKATNPFSRARDSMPHIFFCKSWISDNNTSTPTKHYCCNRTYPIKKALHEPLESVKTRMTAFFFLMMETSKGKHKDLNELSCGKSECWGKKQ